LLKSHLATDEVVGRLEREARLASQLVHPNTISIYDYGRTPEGALYYVMEYLEGRSLDEIVAPEGPLPAARVIHVLRQLCGALRGRGVNARMTLWFFLRRWKRWPLRIPGPRGMRLRAGRAPLRGPHHEFAATHGQDLRMKTRTWIFTGLLLAAGFAQAQAPVEDRSRAVQQGQHRAGIAHRELSQARHDAKLAEQDVLNLREAHAVAQQQADQRKRELDMAQKTLAAARARLSAAQQVYDREIGSVDAAHRGSAPPGK